MRAMIASACSLALGAIACAPHEIMPEHAAAGASDNLCVSVIRFAGNDERRAFVDANAEAIVRAVSTGGFGLTANRTGDGLLAFVWAPSCPEPGLDAAFGLDGADARTERRYARPEAAYDRDPEDSDPPPPDWNQDTPRRCVLRLYDRQRGDRLHAALVNAGLRDPAVIEQMPDLYISADESCTLMQRLAALADPEHRARYCENTSLASCGFDGPVDIVHQ